MRRGLGARGWGLVVGGWLLGIGRMKKLRDDGVKILIVGEFWWIGGYAIGAGVTSFLNLLDLKVELATTAAWANLVVGLVLLLSIIRQPHLSHLFFDGPTV